MNSNKLLRFATIFYSLAAEEELPADSEDQKVVLTNLEKLETYAARKKYAEKNFKHLSSGSSRIVYLTPNKTVIKMGKNDRGIAQNLAEAKINTKSKFFNSVINSSKDGVWIETNYLEKITEKEFEEMTKIKFKDFAEALSYGLRKVSSDSDGKEPDNFDKVKTSDIYKEVKEVAEKYKLLPGDLGRISSWGEKDNYPVLLDFGLNREIYDDFYEESSIS